MLEQYRKTKKVKICIPERKRQYFPMQKIPVNPDPTDVSMPTLETKTYKVNFQMSVKF